MFLYKFILMIASSDKKLVRHAFSLCLFVSFVYREIRLSPEAVQVLITVYKVSHVAGWFRVPLSTGGGGLAKAVQWREREPLSETHLFYLRCARLWLHFQVEVSLRPNSGSETS